MKKNKNILVGLGEVVLLFGMILLVQFIVQHSIDWLDAVVATIIFTVLDIILKKVWPKNPEENVSRKNEIKRFVFTILIAILLLFVWYSAKFVYINYNNQDIPNIALELSVKRDLINIAKNEFPVDNNEKVRYAEGNKILGVENKNGQIYAYVVAEYGAYQLDNGIVVPISASAGPITLIYNVQENVGSGYVLDKYLKPSNDGDDAWLASLKEMYPLDLIDDAKVDYADEFYRQQINFYLSN